jgi:hypothetical protein
METIYYDALDLLKSDNKTALVKLEKIINMEQSNKTIIYSFKAQ